MQIKVYQINLDRDVNGVCFRRFEDLERITGTSIIDMNIYDMVYEADLPCNTLEDVFRILNTEHPQDYKGRSLSVSDIVEIRIPTGESRKYFCDSIGFVDIQEARKEQLLSAALDWIWEHTEYVDDGEFKRVLKEHLGMTEEEISEYGSESDI